MDLRKHGGSVRSQGFSSVRGYKEIGFWSLSRLSFFDLLFFFLGMT
jgi:hypothetical protein